MGSPSQCHGGFWQAAMTLGNQRGIRPSDCNDEHVQSEVGGVGAVGANDDEEKDFFEDVVAQGLFEDASGGQGPEEEVEMSHVAGEAEEDGN